MRRAIGILIPATVITGYYSATIGGAIWLIRAFPAIQSYLPLGGIDYLAGRGADTFEAVHTASAGAHMDAVMLATAMVGTVLVMIPISWVYFITYGRKDIDQSFVQTIVILPIVVAGIATIVQNSVALAFSLAGVVAAVRFRFTLDKPAHALYIFAAIGIGLGAGIGALDIAAVISAGFVYATLAVWALEYGGNIRGPFLAFLTGRDRDQDDY